MSNYEAIILCGGKGTRVSRFTKHIPKCLIDINGIISINHTYDNFCNMEIFEF